MPQVSNAVEALEWRATSPDSWQRDKLALEGADGTQYTWAGYYDAVQKFARALVQISHPTPRSNGSTQYGVAIHAFNEPRWFISALGALAAGWTVSGIYLTNTYDQAAHVLRTSDIRVLVIESRDMLSTIYANVLTDFPLLKVVCLTGAEDMKHPRVVSFDDFAVEHSKMDLMKPCDLPDDYVASLVCKSTVSGRRIAFSRRAHFDDRDVCMYVCTHIPSLSYLSPLNWHVSIISSYIYLHQILPAQLAIRRQWSCRMALSNQFAR